MPRQIHTKFPHIVLVSALMSALPASLVAQQTQPGPVLPPPSLYDSAPAQAPAAVPATVPRSAEAPRPSAPPATVPQTSTAPAPRMAEPAAAPASAAANAPVQAKEPWYRSIFSWFGGGKSNGNGKPAMATPTAVPPQPIAGRAAPTAERSEFAYDSPSRTIRTGALGQCIKTGMWSGQATADCDAGTRMAAPAPTATVAAVARTPNAEPAPVEVQPLSSSAIRDERPLEPELAAVQESMVAPEPVAELEPEVEPEPVMETMVLSGDALFAINSYAIKAGARENLDEFVARLLDADYDSIKITGHTDPTGPAQLNERLSKQRAEAVKRYLVARGVEPDRIQTEGVGSSQPVVTDMDCSSLPRSKKIACYQPDRRVEIEVTGARLASENLDDEAFGER